MNGMAGSGRLRSLSLLLLLAITVAGPAPHSHAQSIGGLQLNYRSHMSGATAASLEIEAEAQYLRAVGAAAKDASEARKNNAEAQRLEQDNRQRALHDIYERKELAAAERARKIALPQKNREAGNKLIAQRLKNHPELNGTEVTTGTALNFLKNRLASTVVAIHAAGMGPRDAVDSVARQLHVTSQIVHSLRVRQSGGRGESSLFRLDEGRPAPQVEWWPPALRSAELNEARSRFEKARAEIFTLQTSAEFEVNIRKLIQAHLNLEAAFFDTQKHKKRTKSVQAWEAYNDATAFLKTLSGEVSRMDKLGPGQTAPQDLAYRGSELPELLAHMVRNGLEFAPAQPGEEAAYHQVFQMFLNLYIALEADREQEEAAKGK